MSPHLLYVTAAYGLSLAGLVALVGWILLDHRTLKRSLAALEARGVRRRADARQGSDA
jgi:heme exporter protein D